MVSAEEWIDRLGLTPHPEGGCFRETYRAGESLPGPALPGRYGGARAFSTAIYFLLRSGERSALHRVASDELWHWYAGSAATLHLLADGELTQLALGPDPAGGQLPQRVVPAGTWFGATVDEPDSYVLVGCTVAPGFDFADFELADRAALVAAWPHHRQIIEQLTPGDSR